MQRRELTDVHLLYGADRSVARTVDEDVDAAEPLECHGDAGRDFLRACHVQTDGRHSIRGFAYECVQRLGVPGGGDDLIADGQSGTGDGQTGSPMTFP